MTERRGKSASGVVLLDFCEYLQPGAGRSRVEVRSLVDGLEDDDELRVTGTERLGERGLLREGVVEVIKA